MALDGRRRKGPNDDELSGEDRNQLTMTSNTRGELRDSGEAVVRLQNRHYDM